MRGNKEAIKEKIEAGKEVARGKGIGTGRTGCREDRTEEREGLVWSRRMSCDSTGPTLSLIHHKKKGKFEDGVLMDVKKTDPRG